MSTQLIVQDEEIPNDDKMILRKNVQEEDESLISLLEKYRKQGAKDLTQLQVYLRKFIQRYKLDNPKYPTLKIGRGSESCLSFNKRSSFSFSVNNNSKVSFNLAHSQMYKQKNKQQNLSNSFLQPKKDSFQAFNPNKSKQSTPMKSGRQNYFGLSNNLSKNNIKPTLKLNTSIYKEEEKNYQEMIKKRKTQKLRIQTNKVSVTIENQSPSPLNSFSTIQKSRLQAFKIVTENSILNQSNAKVNDSMFMPIQSVKKVTNKQKQHNQEANQIVKVPSSKIQDDLQVGDLLSTMSFKMKIDEPEEERNVNNSFEMRSEKLQAILSDSNPLIAKRVSVGYGDYLDCQQIKRKLFDSSKLKAQTFTPVQKSQQNSELRMKQDSYPLTEIVGQRNAKVILRNEEQLKSKDISRVQNMPKGKENFNSGQKNYQNDSFLKQNLNHSIARSQTKSLVNSNISSISKINKQNEENNDVISYYLKSYRHTGDLYSHRLLDQSKAFLKSSVREKQEKSLKDSKSSRMQFSNRMQEIISGRKQNQDNQKDLQKSYHLPPSYSSRDKQKPKNKLSFWNRIQQTIHE